MGVVHFNAKEEVIKHAIIIRCSRFTYILKDLLFELKALDLNWSKSEGLIEMGFQAHLHHCIGYTTQWPFLELVFTMPYKALALFFRYLMVRWLAVTTQRYYNTSLSLEKLPVLFPQCSSFLYIMCQFCSSFFVSTPVLEEVLLVFW